MEVEKIDKFIFSMIVSMVKAFGTDDAGWNCAAEQLINTIFSMKNVKAYKKAELFYHCLLKKMSSE